MGWQQQRELLQNLGVESINGHMNLAKSMQGEWRN